MNVMITRLSKALALGGLVLGGAGVLPAHAVASARTCSPKGARTVVANERVRVFRAKGFVSACDLRRGRSVRLGPSGPYDIGDSGPYVDVVRVTGPLVGYALNWHSGSSGGPFGAARPRLLNMATRHFVHRATCGTHAPEGGGRVTELVLVSREWGGSPGMAWVCYDGGAPGGQPAYAVHRFDATGESTLETSATVLFGLSITYPNVLVGGGPTVYWRKSGDSQVRSAELAR